MKTWIVGDVHGCAAELEELLGRIGPAADDRIVLCGDLFDKGPDPVGVLRLLRRTGAEAVLGNHDAAVRDTGRALLREGTRTTRPPYLGACLDRLAEAGVLEEVVALCEALPLWTDGRLEDGSRYLVVHGGLHPRLGTAGTDERLATTLREFPPGDKSARKWWEQWEGEEAVVFGHDARQGLVQRRENGRVRAIGLDTGCVYGGRLTAWSPELDRFVDVPAQRAWHAV
jgi:hypothetical protein